MSRARPRVARDTWSSTAPAARANSKRPSDTLLQSFQAGGAVGVKIAFFPPLSHRREQFADALAGRDAERRYIVSLHRERRRLPFGGEGEQFPQAVFIEPVICGDEQRQIAVALRAEPIQSKPMRPGIAARIDWPGWGQTSEAVALLVREMKPLGERDSTSAIDGDQCRQPAQHFGLRFYRNESLQPVEPRR